MSDVAAPASVLAIDIGATSIKMADVSADGVIVSSIRKRSTPYPCTPTRLVEWLATRITDRDLDCVGIGFPGEFRDGVVHGSGNLARVAGAGTPVDPVIDAAWRGFPLTEKLISATGRNVVVVNDARMAALGSVRGEGTELVITLGTGFGIALVREGDVVEIDDFGQQRMANGHTYDEALGEGARAENQQQWEFAVRQAVHFFADQWRVDAVHLGGGNAQRLRPGALLGPDFTVIIQGNRAPLRGAARLFSTNETPK